MAVTEFGIIEKYFTRPNQHHENTGLGIGDDCALLNIPEGYQLAVTADTMVENVHFFPHVDPASLGHKLLAVNLSDLAAMGAKPIAVTLAMTLPRVDENWLKSFAGGFLQLADSYKVDLIGGDTTAGPLTLTVQAMGLVPTGKAMRRDTAQVGDYIYLTGHLGDAGLGLKIEQGVYQQRSEQASSRFNRPEPRVNAGLLIRDYASSCIDISDGLVADLGHILEKSELGAVLHYDSLPCSVDVLEYMQSQDDWMMPLFSGDDYELCFTIAAEKVQEFEAVLQQLDCTCYHIGYIEQASGIRMNRSGMVTKLDITGYEHFK